MKTIHTLLLLAFLFSSCNHSPDGRYRITSFKAGDFGDGQITATLKKELYGRQYDIKFDTLNALVYSLTSHEDLTMKRLDSKIPTYFASYTKFGIDYQLFIRREPKMFMRVIATVPPPPNSPPDTIYIAGQMSISHGHSTSAYVECYLEKVGH